MSDGDGKKPYDFQHFVDKNAKSIQEFEQGDSLPALGGDVGRQWQETLALSLVHRWQCEKHIGILARG